MGSAESQLNRDNAMSHDMDSRNVSVKQLRERLAAVTSVMLGGTGSTTGDNSQTHLHPEYHSMVNLANSLLLNNNSSISGTRPKRQSTAASTASVFPEHYVDQRNLKEMVSQCLDFMEEQQRNLAAKDREISELQHQIEKLKSMNRSLNIRLARLDGWKNQQLNHQTFQQDPLNIRVEAAVSPRQRTPPVTPTCHTPRQQPSPSAGTTAVGLPSSKLQSAAGKRRRGSLDMLKEPSIHDLTVLSTPPPVKKRKASLMTSTDGVLLSQQPYSVPDVTDSPLLSNRVTASSEIAVPSWRVKPVQRRWQIEGIEDITEEFYEALHRKPEADEKRRQRWDQQRQREAAYCARLRERQEKQLRRAEEKAGTRLPCSVLPDESKIRKLEVTAGVLPVCVWGRRLRHVESREWRMKPESGRQQELKQESKVKCEDDGRTIEIASSSSSSSPGRKSVKRLCSPVSHEPMTRLAAASRKLYYAQRNRNRNTRAAPSAPVTRSRRLI